MRKVKVKVFRFKFRFAHWIGRSPEKWPAESVSWATLMHWEWNRVCRPERKHRLPSTRWDDNLTFFYICSTVTQWEMVACCQGSFLVVRLSADLPNPLWFVQFWPPVSSTKHRNFESTGRKWKKYQFLVSSLQTGMDTSKQDQSPGTSTPTMSWPGMTWSKKIGWRLLELPGGPMHPLCIFSKNFNRNLSNQTPLRNRCLS